MRRPRRTDIEQKNTATEQLCSGNEILLINSVIPLLTCLWQLFVDALVCANQLDYLCDFLVHQAGEQPFVVFVADLLQR